MGLCPEELTNRTGHNRAEHEHQGQLRRHAQGCETDHKHFLQPSENSARPNRSTQMWFLISHQEKKKEKARKIPSLFLQIMLINDIRLLQALRKQLSLAACPEAFPFPTVRSGWRFLKQRDCVARSSLPRDAQTWGCPLPGYTAQLQEVISQAGKTLGYSSNLYPSSAEWSGSEIVTVCWTNCVELLNKGIFSHLAIHNRGPIRASVQSWDL